MADSITTQTATLSSIPDATKISTDEDVTNGHVQRMKLAVSADGSSTHVGADASGLQVQGAAAENAAVAGNPLLAGGRYDSSPRTLGNGDVGALALNVAGGAIVDGSGVTQPISAASLPLPTGAATSANQLADGHSVSALGNVAHDAVDSGNPVKTGAKAIAHGANPTAVAAADRVDSIANRAGMPFVMAGHPNTITKHLNITDADGAQTDTAVVTVATGTKIVVTHYAVTCDAANTVAVQCRMGFGTTTTPAVDTDAFMSHPGIAAGSGVTMGNGGGILAIGADDEDLRLTCEDPVGGNIDIVVGYYTIES